MYDLLINLFIYLYIRQTSLSQQLYHLLYFVFLSTMIIIYRIDKNLKRTEMTYNSVWKLVSNECTFNTFEQHMLETWVPLVTFLTLNQ